MCLLTLDTATSVRQRPSAVEARAYYPQASGELRGRAPVTPHVRCDTFAARVEEVYAATSRAQLDELVVDLPERSALARALSAAVCCLSRLTALVEDAWREPRTPRFALPINGTVMLGRSRDCDCVLTDPTVSRRHASLRYRDGTWWLRDLRSSNGTCVNGCRGGGRSRGTSRRPGELRRRDLPPRPAC
jgi:FHA domain